MKNNIRKYNDYCAKSAAAIILSDVVLEGKSSGWSGNLDQLEELKQMLKPFNVSYVCDFQGTWERTT